MHILLNISQVSALILFLWYQDWILGDQSGNFQGRTFHLNKAVTWLCPSVGNSSLNWLKKWTISCLDREAPSCRAICGTGPQHYHPPVTCSSFSLEHSHCGKIISWASSAYFPCLLEINQNCGWKSLMRNFVKPVFNQAIWAQLSDCSDTHRGGYLSEGYCTYVFGDKLQNHFQFLFSHWV